MQLGIRCLNWGLRTWDHWYFNDLDQRFGDNWPGQIPAQLVAHTLYYFTQQGDLVFDPTRPPRLRESNGGQVAGGGVVADTCLAFNRKCWCFDLVDHPETRPEIEVFQWSPETLLWPAKGKEKPDFVFLDPPASPEGEADGGQVRLILSNWQAGITNPRCLAVTGKG